MIHQEGHIEQQFDKTYNLAPTEIPLSPPCLPDFFTNLGKEDEEIWQPAKDKYLRCVRSNWRMEKLWSSGKFLNVEEQKQLHGWL